MSIDVYNFLNIRQFLDHNYICDVYFFWNADNFYCLNIYSWSRNIPLYEAQIYVDGFKYIGETVYKWYSNTISNTICNFIDLIK